MFSTSLSFWMSISVKEKTMFLVYMDCLIRYFVPGLVRSPLAIASFTELTFSM